MTTPVPLPPTGDTDWSDWGAYIESIAERVEALATVAVTGQFSDLLTVPNVPTVIVWDGTGTAPERPATTRQVQWFIKASAPQPAATGSTNGGTYATAPGDAYWIFGTPA